MFVVAREKPVNRIRIYMYQFKKFHESLDMAYAEAKRLADKEKAKFIVLEVLGEVIGKDCKPRYTAEKTVK